MSVKTDEIVYLDKFIRLKLSSHILECAFSREPRLYKRVCLSVCRSIGWSIGNAFVSAGRDEPANDLFCVYKLVFNKI